MVNSLVTALQWVWAKGHFWPKMGGHSGVLFFWGFFGVFVIFGLDLSGFWAFGPKIGVETANFFKLSFFISTPVSTPIFGKIGVFLRFCKNPAHPPSVLTLGRCLRCTLFGQKKRFSEGRAIRAENALFSKSVHRRLLILIFAKNQNALGWNKVQLFSKKCAP